MRRLMLVSLVLAFLGGCASAKFTGNAASLTVTRAKWNPGAKVYLLLGGTQLGPLTPGNTLTITFKPGTYIVGARASVSGGNNVKSITVGFEERSHVCLLIGSKANGDHPKAVMELIRCQRRPGEAPKPIPIPMIGNGG